MSCQLPHETVSMHTLQESSKHFGHVFLADKAGKRKSIYCQTFFVDDKPKQQPAEAKGSVSREGVWICCVGLSRGWGPIGFRGWVCLVIALKWGGFKEATPPTQRPPPPPHGPRPPLSPHPTTPTPTTTHRHRQGLVTLCSRGWGGGEGSFLGCLEGHSWRASGHTPTGLLFWACFGLILGLFWGYFGLILGLFWAYFGVICRARLIWGLF